MRWYFYLAYLFGGAFLTNSIPHFVSGVSGRSFSTPFAPRLVKGQSPPIVNVLWGTLNAIVGYFLLCQVGEFHVRSIPNVLVVGAGGLLTAIILAFRFEIRGVTPKAEPNLSATSSEKVADRPTI